MTISSFKNKQLEKKRRQQMEMIMRKEFENDQCRFLEWLSRDDSRYKDCQVVVNNEKEGDGLCLQKYENQERKMIDATSLKVEDATCLRLPLAIAHSYRPVTDCICILNGDLAVVGLDLTRFITEIGDSQVYYMMGKPYCLLQFHSKKTSKVFMDKWEKSNGLLPDRHLLLEYVHFIPTSFLNDHRQYRVMFENLRIRLPLNVCQQYNKNLESEFMKSFKIYQDFFSLEEERQVLGFVYQLENWEILKKRRVIHFGRKFNYKFNQVDQEIVEPIPTLFTDFVLKRAKSLHQPTIHDFDQLTINLYEPGSGIAPHIDTHSSFEDEIWVFSLGDACAMEFQDLRWKEAMIETDNQDGRSVPDNVGLVKPMEIPGYEESVNEMEQTIEEKSVAESEDAFEVILPRRSFMVMTKEGRFGWSHGIRPRKFDMMNGLPRERKTRISLTFRKVNETRTCQCDLPHLCSNELLKHSK